MLRKPTFLAAALLALSLPAAAQSWGIGASIGSVDDATHRFRIDQFRGRDVDAWVQYDLEPQVVLRVTFGNLDLLGVNAGQTATVGGSPVTLPNLTDRVDYVNVGTSYEFWEGDFTSGLFGGIGAYRIRPKSVDPGLESFRDQRETVFGWHFGADASVRVLSRLSVVGRLTYYNVRATATRQIVTANAGLLWKF